jgi:hypothetical protein
MSGTTDIMIPTLNDVNAAYLEARTRPLEFDHFTVGGAQYRQLDAIPAAPDLAWTLWISNVGGDVLADKRDDRELVRLTQTDNEGYKMISILRADTHGPDKYVRRRAHVLVALAFLGLPPTPGALVEHRNDLGWDNDLINLQYGTAATNRARKYQNDLSGGAPPPHKLKKVMLRIGVLRLLKARTGLKGRHLSAFIENLITMQIEPHTEHAQRR